MGQKNGKYFFLMCVLAPLVFNIFWVQRKVRKGELFKIIQIRFEKKVSEVLKSVKQTFEMSIWVKD